MRRYSTLLFDADNTLLDFYAAERRAIRRTCEAFGVPFSEEVGKLYSQINDGFWKRFERGEIERSEIYTGRFRDFVRAVGASVDFERMSLQYTEELSAGGMLLEGAGELCRRLSEKYELYIVTNGHTAVQKRRFAASGLEPYFKKIFISEEIGSKKPEKQFFDFVFSQIGETDKARICIIGDSMTSDILGGIRAGIDTCFYNPAGAARLYEPTYEVRSFEKLLALFDSR